MNGLLVGDRHQLREVRLGLADIDERIAVVAEDAELPVEMEVHGGRLEAVGVPRVDAHPPGLDGRADVPVGEDAHRRRVVRRGVVVVDRGASDASRLGAGATSSKRDLPRDLR